MWRWPVLILPFGIQNGFVRIGFAFIATQHGLNITDGALLVAAQFATQWLKWLWAPLVDLTLSHATWYRLSGALSAISVVVACAIPLGPDTLTLELIILACGGLANSFVAMSVEAMMITQTPRDQIGTASGWFQAGSLGGIGVGGGFGLLLLKTLSHQWMAGVTLGALIVSPCLALHRSNAPAQSETGLRPAESLQMLLGDIRQLLRAVDGRLLFVLSMLPIGLGAAFSVLAQAAVARHWGANASHVALVQGLLAGVAAIVGSLAGGRLCSWRQPLRVYAGAGASVAIVTFAMPLFPPTVTTFTAGVLAYTCATGAAYASFTAVVLERINPRAGSTEYNIFASLANFPLWWLGLLLGWVAQRYGPNGMLRSEGVVGLVGVITLLILSARHREGGVSAPMRRVHYE